MVKVMKKEYIKPTMEVVAIAEQALLAGSLAGNSISEDPASNDVEVLSRPHFGVWDEDE